jgi:hypothetical protein
MAVPEVTPAPACGCVVSWAGYGDQFTGKGLWDAACYQAGWHYVVVMAKDKRSHRYLCSPDCV